MVLVVPVRVLRGGLRKKDGAHLSGDGGDLLIIWLERPMDAGALQEWRAVDDSGSSQADVRFFLFPFRLRLERKVRRRGVASGASGGRSLYLTNFGSQEKKPMYQIEGGP